MADDDPKHRTRRDRISREPNTPDDTAFSRWVKQRGYLNPHVETRRQTEDEADLEAMRQYILGPQYSPAFQHMISPGERMMREVPPARGTLGDQAGASDIRRMPSRSPYLYSYNDPKDPYKDPNDLGMVAPEVHPPLTGPNGRLQEDLRPGIRDEDLLPMEMVYGLIANAGKSKGGSTPVPTPPPGSPFAYHPVMPQQSNLPMAEAEMNLTPQEQALYMRHLYNLYSPGGITNPNGSRSTLMQAGVNIDGKEYNIPTVYDGRFVPIDEAVNRAKAQGMHNFPSYNTPEEAEARYQQMHKFMERDVPQPDPAEEIVNKTIQGEQ